MGIVWVLVLVSYKSPFANVDVVNKVNGKVYNRLQTVRAGDYDYVSVADFAASFNFPYQVNSTLKQISITLENHHLTLTAFNPFVTVDDKIIQFPLNDSIRNVS